MTIKLLHIFLGKEIENDRNLLAFPKIAQHQSSLIFMLHHYLP